MITVKLENGIATFEEIKYNPTTVVIEMKMNGESLILYAPRENYIDLQYFIEVKYEVIEIIDNGV